MSAPASTAQAPAASEPKATNDDASVEASAAKDTAPSDTAAKDEVTAKNTLYIEGFGSAGIYSLNYERRFGDFNVRAGASLIGANGVTAAFFPIGFNYIGIGGRQDHLELGATVTIGTAWDSSAIAPGLAGSPIVGYRFQKPDGGFNFRVGATALIGLGGVMPWGYISFGGTF